VARAQNNCLKGLGRHFDWHFSFAFDTGSKSTQHSATTN
jgi:hypothetical protein